MPTEISLSKEFLGDFQQSTETTMANLVDVAVIEVKKLAPFAKPSQYPNGYPGNPGDLVESISRKGQGMNQEIVSSVPYAVRRNYENYLNPQTKRYIERGVDNALNNRRSQWYQVVKAD